MIRISTFGRLRMMDDHGRSLAAVHDHPTRAALLVYLAVAGRESVPPHILETLLWPALAPDASAAALRSAIWHLRRALGPGVLLRHKSGNLSLDPERVWCDAAAAATALRAGDDATARALAREPFLDGFTVDAASPLARWVQETRAQWRSQWTPETVARPRRRVPRPPFVIAAVASMLFATAWWSRPWWTRASPDPASRVVLVLPFAFHGDSSQAFWGQGIVSLLTPVLDASGRTQILDAAAALPAAEAPDAAESIDPATADGLTTRLGADGFILGDVYAAGNRWRVTATHYGRSGDLATTQSSAEGSDLYRVVDALARGLATDTAVPPPRPLAARTTAAPAALYAYVEGEVARREGRTGAALDAYRRAARDATFALAHLRWAELTAWFREFEARRAADRASRYLTRLSPPERGVLRGLEWLLAGEADSAERRLRTTLTVWPETAAAWGPLALTLFRFNPMRGRPIAEAEAALRRALHDDVPEGPADQLRELAAIARDRDAFAALLPDTVPESRGARIGLTVWTLLAADAPSRARYLRVLRALPDADLVHLGRHLLFMVEDADRITPVLRLLVARTRPASVRVTGYVLLAHLAAGGGRWREADAALVAAERLDRARALEHRALLCAMPFAPYSRSHLAAIRGALVRWDPPAARSAVAPPEAREPHALLRSYLIGQIAMRMGDLAVALGYADALDALDGPPEARRLGRDLAAGLRARVAQRRGRSLHAQAMLDRVTFAGAPGELLGIVAAYEEPLERWLRADVLRALGRPEAALGWFGTFESHSPFGRAFLAPAAVRRGELAEALGRRDEARRQYARALDLWRNADPELAGTIRDVRARLARLRAE